MRTAQLRVGKQRWHRRGVQGHQQQDAERAREQQFTELSTRGLDLLDDVVSEIAGDVQTEADELDEFFANLRFE